MSKIFRLYKGGTNTYQDWNNSPSFPYNSGVLTGSNMPDPDGAKASREITSIPSPFARIDLVKNAFKEIFSKQAVDGIQKCLDGNTIFHKMVSDTLDVGEIFFNYDKFSSVVEIIAWDPSIMIDALDKSGVEGQRCYANVLRKFMNADKLSYNFGTLQNVYLLNYKNGPQQLNIIGATSPASVFFSTANKIDYIKDIQFGTDRPFDNVYQPLYKRDPEYIKFWFLLKNTINGFSRLFPEVDQYLNLTFQVLTDQNLKRALNGINDPKALNFDKIAVKSDVSVNHVEVLGNLLFQHPSNANITKSDFTINSVKHPDSKVLVLPVEKGNVYKDLQYTTALWGTENHAPYVDQEPDLSLRRLPNDFTQHAYLTISDFLEDTLIIIPHILNDKAFLALNNFSSDLSVDKTYLLPLKPLFFTYFSVEDLKEQDLLSVELLGVDSIKVILRIPIVGNRQVDCVEYSRIYYTGKPVITATQNDGGIYDDSYFEEFEVVTMPNVRYPKGANPEYRVATVSPYSNRSILKFYKDGDLLQIANPIIRNQSYQTVPKCQTYILTQDWDYMQIEIKGVESVLVPLFATLPTSNTIEFAVDLGTSNTHIEMVVNGKKTQIQPFGFTSDEMLQSCAFLPTYAVLNGKSVQKDLIDIKNVIERDFLPLEIQPSGDYGFPTRTVLSYGECTNWQGKNLCWADTNISMPFGKLENLQYNKYEDNIKWSNEGNSAVYAQSYIDNLMFLLRCKALAVGTNLNMVSITWFYPSSMSKRRFASFSQAWAQAYSKFFSGNKLNYMTEALAPVLYFFNRYASATDMVTIDIGGGTTDIAFATNKNVNFVSSFRFAANTLFEDSFSRVNSQNGIVDHFKVFYQEFGLSKLDSLLDEFEGQPANLASTFFTLKDSPIIKNSSVESQNVDFCKMLFEDENFKICFLIFYTAIIYHVGQIIKAKDLKLPRHIAFSGNGSNVIRSLVPSNKIGIGILSDFTKIVLESVTGKKYDDMKLDILGLDEDESPKRATCRGGFLLEGDTTQPESIVLKSSNGTIATASDTYDGVDESYIQKVEHSVSDFYDFMFGELTSKVNFYDSFGISKSSLQIARENCKSDISTYIKKGIELRKTEETGSDNIAETFFFYPIKGALQTISQNINESLKI